MSAAAAIENWCCPGKYLDFSAGALGVARKVGSAEFIADHKAAHPQGSTSVVVRRVAAHCSGHLPPLFFGIDEM
jgi:hypothetical protein